jgi:hypothetical protein
MGTDLGHRGLEGGGRRGREERGGGKGRGGKQMLSSWKTDKLPNHSSNLVDLFFLFKNFLLK